MTAATAQSLISRHGIQHHGRSLLVWPGRLDGEAAATLRDLVVTGSRVLSLAERLPPDLDRLVPEPVPLRVWYGESAAPPHPVPAEVPDAQEWGQLVRLWRESGITPLAEHIARADPGWRHARHGTVPVAAASAQALAAPFPGTSAAWLVCCVATRRAYRGRGLAAQCVASAVPRGQAAVAFVEPPGESGRFFRRMEWTECGYTYLYRYY